MPAKQQDQQMDQEKQGRLQVDAAIGRQVMQTLGQPGDLQRVQVRRLWPDHYRVNIFVGGDAATAKVAHSFFLVTDSGGNILASTPAIAKRY